MHVVLEILALQLCEARFDVVSADCAHSRERIGIQCRQERETVTGGKIGECFFSFPGVTGAFGCRINLVSAGN